MSKTICLWGDSIAAGFADKKQFGWFNRLALDFYQNTNQEHNFYNLGICGETTDRLISHLEPEIKRRNPDICLIEIGVNDSAGIEQPENYWVPIEKFNNNLKRIYQTANFYCPNIYFLGLTPVNEELTNPILFSRKHWHNNKKGKKYNKIIKKVCFDKKINFVDLYDLLQNEDLADGLHPNEKGHEKIYAAVKKKLKIEL
ncbi:MAG TPA: GDSL-type esterase/lipase family protein [Patescibacteria group bacterium]|nr:GDSL-type esterase/lipase family protein [Patescibacteria group bacterium]